MAADEIERFRREITERTGDQRKAESITDQELLREVMNTVGKYGTLGGSIRCVVSVSMLTEGWHANTVTHVLGIRAFGTQLLCEQVIGRALRRQSYDLNEESLFNVEYADVFGIPFDFNAKPVIAPPQPPRETIQVKAVRPERDALEIRFPRVEGYRIELPEERLTAEFNEDSILELSPDLVGPSITKNAGIIGQSEDMSLKHLGDMRPSTLLFHVTQRLLYTKWRDPGEEPKLHLFGQLKRITKQWLDNCLVCKGDTYPALLMYQELADMACNRITAGITRAFIGDRPIKALLDPYNPVGSTKHVRFNTSKTLRWDLILLYWDIGRGIVEKQQKAGWGDAVVERLAADLRDEFPDTRGFSVSNLWRMKQLYLDHTAPEFLAQLVRELKKKGRRTHRPHAQSEKTAILQQSVEESSNSPAFRQNPESLAQAVRELVASVPWGHHINVLDKITDPAARLYYLRAVAQLGWSRNVLLNQIKAGAYERAVKEKKTHNFSLALPEHYAEQADEMMKSSYNLEFLGVSEAVKERELENRLIARLQQFILELGYGFCFVGRQYRLALDRKEYFVDLLFYHRFLKALVAFDLKIGSFQPEHAGKMDFYLNLLNEKERDQGDKPSIGIILCAEKNDIEVEFALKTKNNPIGVAEYHLQPKLPAEFKGRLPTAKQLADAVRNSMPQEK